MSSIQNPSLNPYAWMISAGVGEDDVEWLLQRQGSMELHASENRQRVERIYSDAMARVLNSTSPVALIQLMSCH